jgi:hypothetical protein
VFVLREVKELSVEETAACLAILEATARSRMFRARGSRRQWNQYDRDLDYLNSALLTANARPGRDPIDSYGVGE